ncbi:hypothetical protein TeGR_g1255 [Tetraparma gracilis]|uniref:Dolichol kinase n=1 Tax=Tetraparma gracilis TaxID=2962635 RepID=A0ABQ6M473_9STRA|nr:hypothetical protein TeGR_g1255 [Tetraparma gracilis]
MSFLFLALPCIALVFGAQFLFSSASPSSRPPPPPSSRERKRRVQHASTGLVIYLLCAYLVPHSSASAILLLSSLLIASLHLARLRLPRLQALLAEDVFRDLLRDDEIAGRCPGCVYFLLGAGLSLLLYGPRAGRRALLHLSFGDPLAAELGRRRAIGGKSNVRLAGGKSLFGFLGCALACAAATLFLEGKGGRGAGYAVGSGALSAAVELLVPGGVVDDNLALPLVSGFLHRMLLE